MNIPTEIAGAVSAILTSMAIWQARSTLSLIRRVDRLSDAIAHVAEHCPRCRKKKKPPGDEPDGLVEVELN
jgi:hypothetical protein